MILPWRPLPSGRRTRCKDCGRPTRAISFAICAGCLRRRWQAGENWPFAPRAESGVQPTDARTEDRSTARHSRKTPDRIG